MPVKSSGLNVFGVVCLSLALGILLYWVMFISVLPRTLRPEASTALPLLSGLVGASVCGLLYFGFRGVLSSFRRGVSGVGSLILRRNRAGMVVAIETSGGQPVVYRSRAALEKRVGAKALDGRLRLLKGVIALLLVAEAYLLTAYVMGTWMPFYAIPSASMAPTLNVGDLVIVRGVNPCAINVGDIIVFNVPKAYSGLSPSPVIHRVIAIEWSEGTPFFRTKGDNPSCDVDPWLVPAENILGVYVTRVPFLGYVILALKTPLGLALSALALLACILYPYIRDMLRRAGST